MKWSAKNRRTFTAFTVTLVLVTFNLISFVQAAPQRTTYQAKIIKPDGIPLEASSVNFRFTIMDPSGTCILYVENFPAVNMNNSGGLISLPLGSGTRSYPTSGTTTFSEFFDNASGPRTCQIGATPFVPVATDVRKILMQFQDANGWQTLPAMTINSVPYANYADKATDATNATKLNNKADTAFVELANLPVCVSGEALYFDGVSFSCVPAIGGTVTNVATANAYLTISSSTTTPLITLNVGTVSNTVAAGNDSRIAGAAQKSANLSDLISSATARTNLGLGALATQNSIVASDVTSALGYVPAASGATAIDVTALKIANNLSDVASATVARSNLGLGSVLSDIANKITSSTASLIEVLGYTPANSATVTTAINNKITSSSASITEVLGYAPISATTITGKITSSAASIQQVLGYVPAVSGATAIDVTALKIANNLSDVASATVARTNLGLGSILSDLASVSATANSKVTSSAASIQQVLGYVPAASGAAMLASLNGSTSATQTFAIGQFGVTAGVSTAAGVHTFNFPLASTTGVVGGLLSYADYTTFMNKITSSAVSISQVLGYTPISATTITGKITSSAASISQVLGYVPAASGATDVTALKIANNLSDVASATVARTNLGLGSILSDLASVSATANNKITSSSASISEVLGYAPISATTITGKITSSAASIQQVLGYVPAVSGALTGVGSINGSTSSTQTFALGSFGATPGVSTAAGVHTFNFPLASTTGVVGGLLSFADYTTFMNKITSSAVSISQVLGYTPISATTITGKITSSAASISQVLGYTPVASGSVISSQWVASGTNIYYDLGSVILGSQATRTVASNRGQIAATTTYVQTQASTATVSWNSGNIQEISSFVCNGTNTITMTNIRDGAAYSLLLSGAAAHSGVCVFSASGYTFKTNGGATAPASGRDILFTFAVINNTVIYNMADDLQ